MVRMCKECKEGKGINEFPRIGKKYRGKCKICWNKEKNKYYEKYREKNRLKLRKYQLEYYYNNKKSYNIIQARHIKKKRKNNIQYNLNHKISTLMRAYLKNGKNSNTWQQLVNYSINDLIKYLNKSIPNNYTWQDFLNGKLHIDHIIPASFYLYSDYNDNDFKKCWDLRNLRLLPAKENQAKSNNLNFKLINKKKLINLLPERLMC